MPADDEIPRGPDGLPAHGPWQAGPCMIRIVPYQGETEDPREIFTMTYDTPTSRQVSFWAKDDIIALANKLLEGVGEGRPAIKLATLEDIRQAGTRPF